MNSKILLVSIYSKIVTYLYAPQTNRVFVVDDSCMFFQEYLAEISAQLSFDNDYLPTPIVSTGHS